MGDFLKSKGFINAEENGDALKVMGRIHGALAPLVDSYRSHLAQDYIVGYNGGHWDLYQKDEITIFSMNGQGDVRMVNLGNFFDGVMSREAASLAIAALTYNKLCWELHNSGRPSGSEKYASMFHKIMDLISDHPEAVKIYQFLD